MPVLPLVPLPASVRPGSDAFRLRDGAGDDLERAGVRFERADDGAPESYRIVVDEASALVTAPDDAGLFYGRQTLRRLVDSDERGAFLPALEIDDAPRFAYRGAMLDVARHFFPLDVICGYIDRIAALKLNHLHLHLTDDQGWRIALSSRPELAVRASGSAALGDEGGFYSAEDYAAIVAYAADRFVTIVPEIDVPSHTHAIGLAYPELAADPVLADSVRETVREFGGDLPERGRPYTGFAVGFSSLRTDDERTYDFVADVFGELARMTPGPFLHLGGDEALGTERADYDAFIRRTVAIIAATGKRPIAWHEAGAVPDLPALLVAQYWGYVSDAGDAGGAARAVAEAGGSVILSPADAIYLDMKPEGAAPVGLVWADGPTSVAASYDWDPADTVPGLGESSILGVEAALWTETVRTAADIDFLAFPRIAAAAEIAWSPRSLDGAAGSRSWESFRERVGALGPHWAAEGIAFHRSSEIPWADA